MLILISLLLRIIFLFIFNLAILKITGFGTLSKMTSFKLLNFIIISIITSITVLGLTQRVVFGFIALGIWALLFLFVDYLSLKIKWFHDFLVGKELVLIKDGKVMEENLMTVRYTGEELLRDLRSKNAFTLADVEFAVMESTGELNVLLKTDKKPITPSDIGKKVNPLSEPEVVILDGNILDESLKNTGLNREWLNIQLSNFGVTLDNIFIGQIDSSGELYIDLFDDNIQVQKSTIKEMLYANIAKCQADFLSYALETNDAMAKEMYSINSKRLNKLMDDLEPYLLH